MKKEFTCIVCPNGCNVTVEQEDDRMVIEGALCRRGEEYARQELLDPRRTISTTVLVEGNEDQLLSVRLTKPIPLKKIAKAAEVIHALRVTPPVHEGAVLISHILGEDSDVIATGSVF